MYLWYEVSNECVRFFHEREPEAVGPSCFCRSHAVSVGGVGVAALVLLVLFLLVLVLVLVLLLLWNGGRRVADGLGGR